MRLNSAQILESGFDWITTTGQSRSSQLRLQKLGQKILRDERRAGNDMRPWSFAGYQGFKCGSAQLGSRHDSTCMRISGGLANEHWLDTWQAGENFSRVDLQTTLQLDCDPQTTIASVYRAALKHARSRKRGPRCTLLRSSNGTATVYLGQRQSDLYMRCYDKGRESGLDQYENCVRFEVEIKGPICLQVLRRCAGSEVPSATAASYTSQCFQRRGVKLPTLSAPVDTLCVPRSRSDNARRLAWLEKQIRPCVQHLVSCGMFDEVLRCLDLQTSPSVRRQQGNVVQLRKLGGR